MPKPHTETWLKTSRVLLTVGTVFAWLCTLLLFVGVMGDPAHGRTPAQEAQASRFLYLAFSCFMNSWLLLVLVSCWHRKLRARWTAESAKVWAAANAGFAGTLPIHLNRSPYIHTETRAADKETP